MSRAFKTMERVDAKTLASCLGILRQSPLGSPGLVAAEFSHTIPDSILTHYWKFLSSLNSFTKHRELADIVGEE